MSVPTPEKGALSIMPFSLERTYDFYYELNRAEFPDISCPKVRNLHDYIIEKTTGLLNLTSIIFRRNDICVFIRTRDATGKSNCYQVGYGIYITLCDFDLVLEENVEYYFLPYSLIRGCIDRGDLVPAEEATRTLVESATFHLYEKNSFHWSYDDCDEEEGGGIRYIKLRFCHDYGWTFLPERYEWDGLIEYLDRGPILEIGAGHATIAKVLTDHYEFQHPWHCTDSGEWHYEPYYEVERLDHIAALKKYPNCRTLVIFSPPAGSMASEALTMFCGQYIVLGYLTGSSRNPSSIADDTFFDKLYTSWKRVAQFQDIEIYERAR